MQPSPSNRTPLLALLIANAISLTGNMCVGVALPWFVLQTRGSAADTGLTAFFNTLPLILAAFFGGTLADRMGHRRASITADLLSGATVALIPLLYSVGWLSFPLLLALVFFGALLDTPGNVARQALLPAVARLADVRLEQVNSASAAIFRGSILVGPPLAGVLITSFDPATVFWIDAASFVVSALLVVRGVPRASLLAPGPAAARPGYLEELRAGLGFIRAEPLLRAMLLLPAVVDTLLNPLVVVILPVYLNRTYGSALSYGLLLAGLGGGQLLGTVLYGAWGYKLPRRQLFLSCYLGVALALAPLAWLPPLPVMIGAVLLSGVLMGPVGPLIQTIVQQRTPPAMLARVLGASQGIRLVALPLGMLVGGYALEVFGVQASVAGILLGCLLVAGWAWSDRALRVMG